MNLKHGFEFKLLCKFYDHHFDIFHNCVFKSLFDYRVIFSCITHYFYARIVLHGDNFF